MIIIMLAYYAGQQRAYNEHAYQEIIMPKVWEVKMSF